MVAALKGYKTIFTMPDKTPVKPTEGSRMHTQYGGKSERTKMLRSQTPPGFALAFFEANRGLI